MRLVPQGALRLDGQGTPRPLREFGGSRVHAVAGIGNPARFFRELRAEGIEVVEHAFPDHHRFAARELEFADSAPVLMTDRKSTRLNSSHRCISYAVFCLKKKNNHTNQPTHG